MTGETWAEDSACVETSGEGAALYDLLGACGRGEERAFDELYRVTVRTLYARALRMTGQHESAEEAVQESYLKIWRSAHQFDGRRGAPMTWMFNVVRHQVLDTQRRREHRLTQAEPLDDEPRCPRSDPETQLHGRRVLAQVLDAAAGGPAPKRSCLELMHGCGYTAAEAARQLGLPVATAKTWATRSLAQARSRYCR